MAGESWMTYAARLASFEVAFPIPSKKRASSARGTKSISWPHKSPSPAELARAGFFYKPSAASSDNTTCYLCNRSLDGWEEDDDPVQEHIKHSPSCGWAILMNIGQDEVDPATMEDPTHSSIAEARRATFATDWPHEAKRGWTCKTERMVEAGWHFAPTPESEDFVTCAYCKLSLDGWEPKDNPFEEHFRRSPGCPFFVFAGTTAPKTGRGKKVRVSKASRLSTQSNLPTSSETQSIPELDDSIDDTSSASILSTISTMGNKKNIGAKKKATKTKAQERPTFVEPETLVVEISSMLPTKQVRGEKRTSDQISDDHRGDRESTVKPEPPAKRRNTRSRNSVAQLIEYPSIAPAGEQTDMGEPPTKHVKGGRKRACSVSKKAAPVSVSVLDNAALEAALEADLDRPLSDEEQIEMEVPEKPKGGKSKKIKTSILPGKRAMEPALEEEKPAAEEVDAGSKPRSRKGPANKKGTSKKLTQAGPRSSTESAVAVEINSTHQIETSTFTARTVEDDSGHETDASVGGKSMTRKTSRRKIAGKGRPKKAGTRVVSKTVEDIFQPQTQSPVGTGLAAGREPLQEPVQMTATQDEMELDEKIAQLTKEIEEEDSAPQRPGNKKSSKKKAPKPKKDKVPQLSMPGAFSPVIFDQSAEPSFASVLSPTSPPINSKLRTMFSAQAADEEEQEEMRILPLKNKLHLPLAELLLP